MAKVITTTMILENKNTTVAFRCPICGKAILSGINIFRLSADMLRLRCPDCDQALTVERTKEGKIRLSVPCMICAHPHNLLISENALFGEGLFAVPCGLSGIDIFFAGEEKEVQQALERSGKELQALMDDAGIDSFALLHTEEEETPDPAVEHVVRFLLCELEDEGKISCYCKEEGEIPLYDFQVLSERVRVFCHCCNAETYLPLRSEADAEHFISIDSLELK